MDGKQKLRIIKPNQDEAQAKLPGTELTEMADQQGALLMRVITSKTVNKETALSDIAALHGILEGLAKKTVVTVFALGKILDFVKSELPHGEFGNFIETQCPFAETSAKRYMRIYEAYKDYPKKQLEDLSLSQAYAEAGIKKLAAPPKQAELEGAGQDDVRDFGLPKIEDFDRMLKTPPASGISLKRYRVASLEDGKIHAINETLGVYPIADIYLARHLDKPEARIAFEQAHKDICIAFEIYFAKIEQLEDDGLLPKPEDHRFTVALRKSRGIEAAKTAPKKGKKRSKK